MYKPGNAKHEKQLPSLRLIRRTCNRELYRTIKRLRIHVPAGPLAQAEELYFRKVALNLQWITENGSNRKLLSDWWEREVCPDIAGLWNVEPQPLARAFREAFGG